jgi:hypothetical protein
MEETTERKKSSGCSICKNRLELNPSMERERENDSVNGRRIGPIIRGPISCANDFALTSKDGKRETAADVACLLMSTSIQDFR